MRTIGRYDTQLTANNTGLVRGFRESEVAAKNFARTTSRAVRSVQLQLGAALGSTLGTRQVIEYADAYTEVQNKLRQVTGTTRELGAANAQVFQIATETRSNLEAVATLYARTSRVADRLGISQQQVATFTRIVNQSFQAYGSTASEASSATLQLSQSLAKGALNGDEFRTIAEAAPPIMAAIAREAGVAEGALKDMGARGEISAELIVAAILNSEQIFADAFAETSATVRSNLEVAATAAKRFAGESQGLNAVLTTSSEAAILLANNMDVVGDVLTGVAVVYGSRLAGPLLASTAQFLAQVPATAAATRTLGAYGAVLGGVSRTQALATLAMQRFTVSLAFLGGPAGLAIAAASALLLFSRDVETAEERLNRIEKSVRAANDAIESFRTLGGVQVGLRQADRDLAKARGALDETRAKVEELEAAYDEQAAAQARSGSGFGGIAAAPPALVAARKEVVKLTEEFDAAQSHFDDLTERLASQTLGGISDQRGNSGPNAELGKISDRLREQVDLYGDVSNAARLRYQIEQQAFEGASQEQLDAAIKLAEELDALDTRKRAGAERALQGFREEVALYGEVTNAARIRYQIEEGALRGWTDAQIAEAQRLASELDRLDEQERLQRANERRQNELQAEAEQATNIINLQQEKFRRLARLAAESQTDDVGVAQIDLAARLEQLRQEQIQILQIEQLTDQQKLQIQQDFETARLQIIALSEKEITSIRAKEAEAQQSKEEQLQRARIQVQQSALQTIIGLTKQDSAVQRAALALKAILALKEARIQLAKARAQAVAAGPFPKNLAALGQVGLIGAEVIATLVGLASGGGGGASGVAHGGLDYVPRDQTFFLRQGERVIQPEQNRDLTRALAEGGLNGGMTVNVQVISQGNSEFTATTEERDGELFVRVAEIARATMSNDIQQRRGVYSDLKSQFDLRDAV